MGNIIAKRLSPAQAAVVSAAMLVACMLAPMRQADSCAAISLLVALWWLLQRHFPSERKIAATEGTGVVVFQQQKQLLGEEHERLSFSSGNRESADTINATTQYSDIDDVLRRNHESNSLDESLEEMDSGGGTTPHSNPPLASSAAGSADASETRPAATSPGRLSIASWADSGQSGGGGNGGGTGTSSPSGGLKRWTALKNATR